MLRRSFIGTLIAAIVTPFGWMKTAKIPIDNFEEYDDDDDWDSSDSESTSSSYSEISCSSHPN